MLARPSAAPQATHTQAICACSCYPSRMLARMLTPALRSGRSLPQESVVPLLRTRPQQPQQQRRCVLAQARKGLAELFSLQE